MTAVTDSELLADAKQILREMLGEDWDVDVTLETSLIYDLELESMSIVYLLEQLDGRFPHLRLFERAQGLSLAEFGDLTLADLLKAETAVRTT